MKLNKISVVSGLSCVLANGAAFAAEQGQGTVTFKGSIVDSPCSIPPETASQTVDMG